MDSPRVDSLNLLFGSSLCTNFLKVFLNCYIDRSLLIRSIDCIVSLVGNADLYDLWRFLPTFQFRLF